MKEKIKIAIVGIGNCSSSLIQGIEYYKDKNRDDSIGLMHWDINGYKVVWRLHNILLQINRIIRKTKRFEIMRDLKSMRFVSF